jgi:two-component system chemotaxis response regulator CheB
MPAAFTKSFAERLDLICPMAVVEAANPMPLEPGTIYIGKGGADMLVSTRIGKMMVVPKPENPEMLWHPSVELLGRTALAHYRAEQIIGVMLTGMGSDGADSFTEIRQRGGRTIAESQDSAVIFGMPKELIDRGGASLTLRAGAVATQVNLWAGN